MAYKIKQLTAPDDSNGKFTLTGYLPIKWLGIQARPGSMFYLNGDYHPIIIGKSGVFELEAINGMEIEKLEIDPRSINNNPNLIIDILGGEED